MRNDFIKKFGILAVALLLLLATPAMAAKITKFNGEAASAVDQVSHLVIGKGQSGNVTIEFTNGYVLDSTNATLVIDFAADISSYAYVASGDTANLTVTQNPANLTFTYSGTTNVTISTVDLVFDFAPSAANGIDSNVVMNSTAVLTYVSKYITSLNTTNTTEKVTYIVYDPAKVYAKTLTVKSADENFATTVSDDIAINLTTATTNKVVFRYNTHRDIYDDNLVPIYRGYFSVYLNNTYFTNVVPIPVENVTDIGLSESDGYTKVAFLDLKPAYNDTFDIVAFAWDTNGSIKDGYKFVVTIDPIGGLSTEYTETKNVSVIAPAALAAPPTAYYWWQYEYYGISILAWIGIAVTLIIVAVLIYRWHKGLPIIPRSLGALSSVVAIYAVLTIWTQITEWFSDAQSWLEQNWLFVSIVLLVTVAVFVVSWLEYGLRE